MTELDNALIFNTKKGSRKGGDREDSIYFSTGISNKGYKSIKFYIGSNIARKSKINEKTKIRFGCDKQDKTIWYLVSGDEGYSINKSKNGSSYFSSMAFPFNFLDKKMQHIKPKNIEINSDKRIITCFVFDIFKESDLVIDEKAIA